MLTLRCPVHPHATLICPACVGARGGKVTSPAKTKANTRNGLRPKRPRTPKPRPVPERGTP